MKNLNILKVAKEIVLTFLLIFFLTNLIAQEKGVGINTTSVPADALLNVDATNLTTKKGVLVPKMLTSERDAMGASSNGLLIYNTSTNQFEYFRNGAWTPVGYWDRNGNIIDFNDKVKVFDNGNRGRIEVLADNGQPIVLFDMNVNNDGICSFLNTDGNAKLDLTSANGNALFNMRNNNGEIREWTGVSGDGFGFVQILGPNGERNMNVSALAGHLNNGAVSVYDASNVQKAGIQVQASGDGVVFGDTKNFRMDHPEQPGKEIWYCSVEGPEAAAYDRGVAKLENGEAFIPFSDHYKIVANPETMTVVLTPHSANTYGLAVIEKRADGFKVKEFMNGTGNFKFDWEVKCVRKGYEDYRVIRDAKESEVIDVQPYYPERDNK